MPVALDHDRPMAAGRRTGSEPSPGGCILSPR